MIDSLPSGARQHERSSAAIVDVEARVLTTDFGKFRIAGFDRTHVRIDDTRNVNGTPMRVFRFSRQAERSAGVDLGANVVIFAIQLGRVYVCPGPPAFLARTVAAACCACATAPT